MMTYKYVLLVVLWGVFATNSMANDPWKILATEEKDNIKVVLKIKNQPTPLQEKWLSLEVTNLEDKDLIIRKAHYKFEFKSFAGEKTKTVSLSSYQGLDFQNQQTAVHLSPQATLPPGLTTCKHSLSAVVATKLGYPKQTPIKVRGQVYLDLELGEADQKKIYWPETEFTFYWYPPSEESSRQAAKATIQSLYANDLSPAEQQRLECLLDNPFLKDQLEAGTLTKAIKIRTGKEDGRLAIVKYANKHFPNQEELVDYYRKMLFNRDLQVVRELTEATNIWSDRFLEPIIGWFQNGNSGVRLYLMHMMYAQRKNWVHKEGINLILSDLILYRYEDIVHKQHYELTDRELLVWCSAAQLLGKTFNPENYDLLLPFLKCKKNIPPGTLLTLNSEKNIPGPLRVADVALEAWFELAGSNLQQLYEENGYQATLDPDLDNSAITRIRDTLIEQIEQKHY